LRSKQSIFLLTKSLKKDALVRCLKDGAHASYLHDTVQVAITVLACWLASGIVFGFAALKPVLISEGVYREQCTREELKQNVEICMEQDIR
jgi:hypothetical protein